MGPASREVVKRTILAEGVKAVAEVRRMDKTSFILIGFLKILGLDQCLLMKRSQWM